MLRIGTLLALLLAAPSLLSAQIRALDQFQQTVNRELRRYEDVLDVSEMTHEVFYGELRDDAERTLTVTLDSGTDYLVLGVCDEDCTDLDLRLYQGSTQIDEDVALDDYPVVRVTPSATREYRVEVIMATCSVNPCRFGVAVYDE
jgi:hypothetical protein